MQLAFEVDGVIQLSRNLRVSAVSLAQMEEFHEESTDIIEERSDSLFKKRGRNLEKSNKWKGLSKGTKTARANKWGYYKQEPNNPSLLRWTGNLQDNKTKNFNSMFGELSYNAEYAIYHHKGSGNLPKRALIDLSNSTNTLIVKAMQRKIERDLGVFGSQL